MSRLTSVGLTFQRGVSEVLVCRRGKKVSDCDMSEGYTEYKCEGSQLASRSSLHF